VAVARCGQEGTPVKLGLERGGQPSIVFLVRGCSKTAAYPSIGASADHYPPLFGTASQRAASAAATLQPDVRTPLRLLLDNPEPDHALVSARPASTPVRTPGGTPGEPGGSASKHGRVLFPSLDYFAGTPASPPASASKKTRAPGGGNSRGKGAAALQSLHAGEGLHTSHDRLVPPFMCSPSTPHRPVRVHRIRQEQSVSICKVVRTPALGHCQLDGVGPLPLSRSRCLGRQDSTARTPRARKRMNTTYLSLRRAFWNSRHADSGTSARARCKIAPRRTRRRASSGHQLARASLRDSPRGPALPGACAPAPACTPWRGLRGPSLVKGPVCQRLV